jgi:uncharacterized protein YndB with AHSA1/START domain
VTDTYEVEIDIAARPGRVWQALTDARELEAWFCEHADVSLGDKQYDFWGRHTPGAPSRHEAHHKVLDHEDEHLLRYDWNYLGGDSVVTVTLHDNADGTRVHVLHEGVGPRIGPAAHHPRHLWSGSLTMLRGWIETGRVGPRFDWSWPHVGVIHVEADIDGTRSEVWNGLVAGWSPNVKPVTDAEGMIDVGVKVGLKVLDLRADELYVLEWDDGTAPTVMTYTVADSGGRTRITLVHSGFASDEDLQGMAEGFFSGLYELAWQIETTGSWPPPPPRVLETAFPQSGWKFGVRVLQSAGPE